MQYSSSCEESGDRGDRGECSDVGLRRSCDSESLGKVIGGGLASSGEVVSGGDEGSRCITSCTKMGGGV